MCKDLRSQSRGARAHTHTRTHEYARTHRSITHIHTHKGTHTRKHTHTRTHAHNARTHSHTHTCTHAPPPTPPPPPPPSADTHLVQKLSKNVLLFVVANFVFLFFGCWSPPPPHPFVVLCVCVCVWRARLRSWVYVICVCMCVRACACGGGQYATQHAQLHFIQREQPERCTCDRTTLGRTRRRGGGHNDYIRKEKGRQRVTCRWERMKVETSGAGTSLPAARFDNISQSQVLSFSNASSNL